MKGIVSTSDLQDQPTESSVPILPSGCIVRLINGEKYILPKLLIPSIEANIAYQEELERLGVKDTPGGVSILILFANMPVPVTHCFS
jgi:hypothetical protein